MIPVSIYFDRNIEPDETFFLSLSTRNYGVNTMQNITQITITDTSEYTHILRY